MYDCRASVPTRGLSLVAASGGFSPLRRALPGLSCCRAQAPGHAVFSSCSVCRLQQLQRVRFIPQSGRESRSVLPTLSDPTDYTYSPWNSPGQDTGVGSLSLLQGVSLTQTSNPGLLHCRRILYQLSHQGSPGILEWAAYPFSRVFPTQESNRGLLHCKQILYQLSYQGSPLNAKFLLLSSISRLKNASPLLSPYPQDVN